MIRSTKQELLCSHLTTVTSSRAEEKNALKRKFHASYNLVFSELKIPLAFVAWANSTARPEGRLMGFVDHWDVDISPGVSPTPPTYRPDPVSRSTDLAGASNTTQPAQPPPAQK